MTVTCCRRLFVRKGQNCVHPVSDNSTMTALAHSVQQLFFLPRTTFPKSDNLHIHFVLFIRNLPPPPPSPIFKIERHTSSRYQACVCFCFCFLTYKLFILLIPLGTCIQFNCSRNLTQICKD